MTTQQEASVLPQPTVKRTLTLPVGVGFWEASLLALIILTFIIASAGSPSFATGSNFAITAAGAASLALMVIPMAWVMISGEIDLSVASVFGLAGVIFGRCVEAGLPTAVAIVIGLAVGAVAGLINGVLTVAFGLPSLVVTVGTLGLFRGLAYIMLESRSISDLPQGFATFAQANIPGTYFPYTFVLFLVIAGVAGILLQRGTTGRKTYAVGSSAAVSRFSGIRVQRIKRNLFIFSGTVAALAGMLYAGYVSSARASNGTGLELSVVAIVLIGGVSMYGGKGSFVGVLLSLVLVTLLTSWMSLAYVSTNVQNTLIGLLMIGAVVAPVLASKIRGLARRRE
jgi:rhamnose transport system permease protein